MKILLFGKNGQVGWELQRALAPLGELIALDANTQSLHADFTQPDALVATVQHIRPHIIVNAAAYTAVDKAESEPVLAHTINATAPAVLARTAAQLNAWLVHYSTDYVFAGTGNTAWQEDAPTGPLNVYGQSKLAGEEAIRTSGCRHLILRTSWVYAAHGNNFIHTILRLGQERDSLAVINDQIGAPTGADLLADLTAHMLRIAPLQPHVAGTYHAVAAGETSWHTYATLVLEQARQHGLPIKLTPAALKPIPSSDYPLPALRPLNSRLDTQRLRTTFNLHPPAWQQGVTRMLDELFAFSGSQHAT